MKKSNSLFFSILLLTVFGCGSDENNGILKNETKDTNVGISVNTIADKIVITLSVGDKLEKLITAMLTDYNEEKSGYSSNIDNSSLIFMRYFKKKLPLNQTKIFPRMSISYYHFNDSITMLGVMQKKTLQ